MLLKTLALTTTTTTTTPLLLSAQSSLSKNFSLSRLPHHTFTKPTRRRNSLPLITMNILNKLGFGGGFKSSPVPSTSDNTSSSIPQGPDDDVPAPGQQFAQFGAGCFWGVELALQRVPGVTKTEVGYSQGFLHNPTYEDICSGTTNHSEVVRVQYDIKEGSFEALLDVFWTRHDPTTLNRQGNDVGTQYRSGIYFYTPEQEQAALESKERQQKLLNRSIVTEVLPAKKFYRAEEYHQQYLAKGGRFGFKQSTEKGCNDPIRC
jgi:peptide-methionine (S)-S-oxide reductase